MALIKYSALVTGMSGKLNGSVMARNKGGNYVRNKTTPNNPSTIFQQNVRSTFAFVSGAWRALNDVQLKKWDNLASVTPYTDYFGDSRFLSGFNMHQRINTNLTTISRPTLLVPAPFVPMPSITTLSVIGAAAGGALTITSTESGSMATVKAVIFATPPMPLGRKFVKNMYRIVTVVDGADLDGSAIGPDYVTRFGTLVAGERVSIRVVLIDMVTGQNTVGVEASTIIAA